MRQKTSNSGKKPLSGRQTKENDLVLFSCHTAASVQLHGQQTTAQEQHQAAQVATPLQNENV